MNSSAIAVSEPTMLGIVRAARGRTQKELEAATGVPQAVLSKAEGGLVDLDDDRISALAHELDVPADLLRFPQPAGEPVHVFHRKRSALPVSKVNQFRAMIELSHVQTSALFKDQAPRVVISHKPLPDDAFETPQERAQELRRTMGLEPGPVKNMVQLLESCGVVVVRRDLGSNLIDALISWPDGRAPLVLIGDHAPGDRLRFTLAHELGHAVMHKVPSNRQEAEADQFASEFLMPADDIRHDLNNVSLARLAELKLKWRVSMAALLRRARDLGAISDFRYKQVNIDISTAGYRKSEPVEITQESPHAVAAAISTRIASGESIESIARDAMMTTEELRDAYVGSADVY
ncbi:ImmA/IrrE family metallo-endopeptidase [Aeromicrobium terrae]|uniref:ImmA/IrrE family metallo-endopeptidase n=1 Tax=Aeromicrobium terrae TaxID=2498846 RepID=A0A5C8NHW8_9ACTN|nr:XRE family transcriptional regulator [Aeromicrobium terrae]TXL61484.1 ImmA/IrrE family metallo-endopeptidase [Aeromicrobium terrae]